MNELDRDAVRTETVTRLVDLAIANAVRGIRVGMAVEDLVGASGADVTLLREAAEAAGRLVETSPNDRLVVAVLHLRAAHQYLGDRVSAVTG